MKKTTILMAILSFAMLNVANAALIKYNASGSGYAGFKNGYFQEDLIIDDINKNHYEKHDTSPDNHISIYGTSFLGLQQELETINGLIHGKNAVKDGYVNFIIQCQNGVTGAPFSLSLADLNSTKTFYIVPPIGCK